MSKIIKRELVLDGLDCANCAAKIETKVNGLADVNKATFNFATKILSIELDNIENVDGVIELTKRIVNKYEPHVIVKEKIYNNISKRVLVLMGIVCTGCMSKIEDKVKNLKEVKNAYFDFASGKLIIEAKEKDIDKIIKEAKKIINMIEPDVEVIEEERQKNKKNDNEHHKNKQDNVNGFNKKELVITSIGVVLFILAIAFDFSITSKVILYFSSYLLIGRDVLWKAIRNIYRGQIFDENFLMVIATVGAFAIRKYPEGVAVMLFYQVGEFFQNAAVNRSRKSISDLMDIRPDYANLKIEEDIKIVSPEDVKVGDLIIVKPGEKIPLDGKVVQGTSMLDTSALTGESIPRKVEKGNEVLSGFINKNSVLTVEVVKEFGESTVSKILDLVQNASSNKAPTENFITKFARYYTPVVVVSALLFAIVPPLLIEGASFSDWIYRALVFLVISCPCALVISIPLGFFGGIGGASRNGILIKGGNYLEALNNAEIVVFDKTGTLTKGVFEVNNIQTENGLSKEMLLEYAAYAESFSNHPIALSIMKKYGKEIYKNEIESYDEISGHGIKAVVKGKELLAGNSKLMKNENINTKSIDAVGTIVHIAIDKNYAGYIVISDEIKEDAKSTIKELKTLKISKTVMLTGDSEKVAVEIGNKIGIDKVFAELLPQNKVENIEILEKEKTSKGKLVFVGDGINDAPVLARSDIGIAMGGLGSDAAIEAADVVLMTDEPSKIVSAIKIAQATKKIVMQNIVFSLGVKGIVLLLGAFGLASMWAAVFADVGVALIAVLNSMRVLNIKDI